MFCGCRQHLLLVILSAMPAMAAAQSHDVTEAQRWSLSSPWSGSLGRPGWQFDAIASAEFESDFGSENPQLIRPFAQPRSSESGENFNGLLRGLYEDLAGRRYFVRVENESANAELWWPVRNDWLLGTSLRYSEGNEYVGEASQNVFIQTVFPEQTSLDIGISIAKRWGDYTLSGGLQTDLQNSRGLSADFAARWDKIFAQKIRLAAFGDISFGDSRNLNADFGVAPGQAGASGLAPYSPSAGLRSSKLGIELEYRFFDSWSLFSNANAEYFYPNAGDSPRVGGGGSEGSETADYSVAVGVRYRLDDR